MEPRCLLKELKRSEVTFRVKPLKLYFTVKFLGLVLRVENIP